MKKLFFILSFLGCFSLQSKTSWEGVNDISHEIRCTNNPCPNSFHPDNSANNICPNVCEKAGKKWASDYKEGWKKNKRDSKTFCACK